MRFPLKTLIPSSLALAALLGGALVYVEADKTVLLSVDGQTREVQTFAGSVSGLLEQEGIEVDSKDTVAPDPSTELTEGQKVAVRNGRLVSVTVDGEAREVWTTATTVDEALVGLGYRGDRVYASASRSKRIPLDGLALEVRTPKNVTIVADGASRAVVSTMGTVEALLGQYDVTLSATDEVSVPLTTRPTNDLVVTVVRVSHPRGARRAGRAVWQGAAPRRVDDGRQLEGAAGRRERLGRRRVHGHGAGWGRVRAHPGRDPAGRRSRQPDHGGRHQAPSGGSARTGGSRGCSAFDVVAAA